MQYSMLELLAKDDVIDIVIVSETVYGFHTDWLGCALVAKYVDKKTGTETPLAYAATYFELQDTILNPEIMRKLLEEKGIEYPGFYRVGGVIIHQEGVANEGV